MRLINEIAYQERLAKIPMEERTFRKAVEVAEDMPTIDAVPVVRCVNCVHYGAEASAFDAWTPFCLKHKLTTFPDDFCSCGERRADDEQQSVL